MSTDETIFNLITAESCLMFSRDTI